MSSENEFGKCTRDPKYYTTKLYRRVGFLCCSSETKRFKERKKYFKRHLEEAKRTKEYSDAVKRHLRLTTPASV